MPARMYYQPQRNLFRQFGGFGATGQLYGAIVSGLRLKRGGAFVGTSDGGLTAQRSYGSVTRQLGSPLGFSKWVAGVYEKYGASGNNSYEPADGDPFIPFDGGKGDNSAAQARIEEGYNNCGTQ